MSNTLSTLLTDLDGLPPDALLTFAGPAGATRGAWHVTRLTHATLAHIDCDGRTSDGHATVLELLDLGIGKPMSVARFREIALKSGARVPDLADAPLRILLNATQHVVEGVGPGAVVTLRPDSARCRPAGQCCPA
ncbi:hypothetical protein MWU52_16255 [Jannaschia sp. S6380]|uniref:hypothetical protein n=1 Tax=Jannaschia sp. S6380 TaxID=2926408 RepID=UPI001FF17C22|nr:hypothetical protein [Jannaschia sp. S6380]MCK0169109.1 hypothetical protein [Jannaschia sp. S6380]